MTAIRKSSETGLFLKRVLNNPRQLGAVVPSSARLGREMASHIDIQSQSPIVELGGGTGALTKTLVASGIDPKRIYTVELDSELCAYLKAKFSDCHVIHGCAGELESILPKNILGQVGVVVSGLPLLNFPKSLRDSIVENAFRVLAPEGYFLQYTYSPRSSLPAERYGLQKEKMGRVLRNIPPATVWKYYR